MNKTQVVQSKITKLPPGEVFSSKSLNLERSATTRKILSRLEEKGVIQPVIGRQGFYFIPKKGIFGTIKPPRGAIIKALLDGENKGYRSGLFLYNKLGLTTQVPGKITIVCNMYPRTTFVEGLEVQYKRARAPITDENIPLLQCLDILMDIKTIPDTTPSRVLEQMAEKIKTLKKVDLKRMIKLSENYPKRVQALLGAIVENLFDADISKPLKKVTLSGSIYKVGVDRKILPNKSRWNIE